MPSDKKEVPLPLWGQQALGVLKEHYPRVVEQIANVLSGKRKLDQYEDRDDATEELESIVQDFLYKRTEDWACCVLAVSKHRAYALQAIDLSELTETDSLPDLYRYLAFFAMREDVADILYYRDDWKLGRHAMEK